MKQVIIDLSHKLIKSIYGNQKLSKVNLIDLNTNIQILRDRLLVNNVSIPFSANTIQELSKIKKPSRLVLIQAANMQITRARQQAQTAQNEFNDETQDDIDFMEFDRERDYDLNATYTIKFKNGIKNCNFYQAFSAYMLDQGLTIKTEDTHDTASGWNGQNIYVQGVNADIYHLPYHSEFNLSGNGFCLNSNSVYMVYRDLKAITRKSIKHAYNLYVPDDNIKDPASLVRIYQEIQ